MSLAELTIASASLEYSRQVWYLPASEPPQKICIFLDGEYYVHRMDAPAQLVRLQADREIPPVECLFISHVNGQARHEDFACHPGYAEFVAVDLINWVRERSGMASQGEHLIGGTSLAGLQAAYTSLCYRERFSRALCQSGSFWWNREWLKNLLAERPATGGQYWISVGDQETESGVSHPPTGMLQEVDQVSAALRFAEGLQRRGSTVRTHLYSGGHAIAPWRDEFAEAMRWLLQAGTP